MGRAVAQGRERFADAPPLFDRGLQRVDGRDQILFVQPRARRAEPGDGQKRFLALAVTGGVRPLVDRKLLSRRQRRTGAGPLRMPRLALCASPLLHHPIESSVLCACAPKIRPGLRPLLGAFDRGTSSQCDERVARHGGLAAVGSSRAIGDRTVQATLLPASQQAGTNLPHENKTPTVQGTRNRHRQDQVL